MRRRLHSFRIHNTGFTLLPVILMMSLIAAIAFLLNRDNGMNAEMVANQNDMERARYAAEAGLQAVNAKIQATGCSGTYPIILLSPVTNSNFGGASYYAYGNNALSPPNTIYSTGTYNGTSVTLSRTNLVVYQPGYKTYTLQPDATTGMDTYIEKNDAKNYGDSNIFWGSYDYELPLLKFDLSMFPSGTIPISSTFSLYQQSGSAGTGSIGIYRVSKNWVEGTGSNSPVDGVNWSTMDGTTNWMPGGEYHPQAAASSPYTSGSNQWINFDITDLATSWLSNRYLNNGMIVKWDAGTGFSKITSSDDSNATQRPKITFNYLLPCGTTGPSDPTGGTITLSPVADSFNDKDKALENAGAATELRLKYDTGKERRILMQFDTSSVPSGSTIQSAILRMYVNSTNSATSNTKSLWANALNESWVEGTGNGTNKNCPGTLTPGTSWNYRTNCTNWSYIHPPNTVQAWSAMAAMPTARTRHMVATVNNKIYAIGGYSPVMGYLGVVEEYNPATNSWVAKAAMPTPRADAAVAVVGGKIYVIGGSNGGSGLTSNEAYDPATNTWATRAAMPTGRMYLAAAAANNKIYALGGTKNGTALKTNEEYDPASNTWATKTQMPTARVWLSAQAANGRIYAIGGWSGSASLNKTEEYNPAANSWSGKTDVPVATDSMASTVIGNKIYLISGYQGNTLTQAVWIYDALNDAYTAQTNYPVALNEPAAAAVNGYLYSMGGDNGGSPPTVYPNHYRYDPGLPIPVATASDETTSALPLAAGFSSGWINFELKALAQEWVDGIRPNNGIVIYTENADDFKINSRENSANKPQLIIKY